MNAGVINAGVIPSNEKIRHAFWIGFSKQHLRPGLIKGMQLLITRCTVPQCGHEYIITLKNRRRLFCTFLNKKGENYYFLLAYHKKEIVIIKEENIRCKYLVLGIKWIKTK